MLCPGPGEGSFLLSIPICHPDGAFLPQAQPCAHRCCGCLGIGSLSMAALSLTPVLSLLQGTARGMGTALASASVRGKCCRPSRPPEVLSALPETSDWHAAPSTSLGRGGTRGPHCGCRPGSSFNNKAAVLRLHALSLARL